jgi:ferric-dicitrate binding protein FerR (iron transport regulator)
MEDNRVMEDLIASVLAGEATEQQRRQLEEWRNELPENERTYQESVRVWQSLLLFASQERAGAKTSVSQIIAAGDRRRSRAIPLKASPTLRRRTWWWVGAAAAAVITVAVGLPAVRDAPPQSLFSTGPGETNTFSLDDGSVIRLGPNSRLGVWGVEQRGATFSGTGFFAIAADSARPFAIRTEAGTAEVLGTRFEVRTAADSLRLVVVEGHVALSSAGQKVDVHGGAMAAVAPGAPPSVPLEVNVWALLDWQDGLLIYHDTPLGQVAAELEAYFGVAFSIADSTLTRRRVTAWFNDEPFEDVVTTICQVVNAHCTVGDTVEMVR